MAYATLAQVKARAGVLGRSWTPSSNPASTDVEGFLTDVAAEIDGVLGARGLAAPADGTAAANALRSVNAAGALVLALEATFEAGRDDGVDKTIDRWRTRYERAFDALVSGKHPAVALLEAAPSAPSASSLWTDEPEYGLYPVGWPGVPNPAAPTGRLSDVNPSLAPTVYRGRSF